MFALSRERFGRVVCTVMMQQALRLGLLADCGKAYNGPPFSVFDQSMGEGLLITVGVFKLRYILLLPFADT